MLKQARTGRLKGSAALALLLSVLGSLAPLVALAEEPFVISVEPDDATTQKSATKEDRNRKADRLLADVDVKLTYDGLDVRPRLNVSTDPVRATYRAGDEVTFLPTSNYPAFIDRAEIIVTRKDAQGLGEEPVVIPAVPNARAAWIMPEDGGKDFTYRLRVYDAKGRYDETGPVTLTRSARGFSAQAREATAPGEGEDHTAIRNIHVHGGAVTVNGMNALPGSTVDFMGEAIPADRNGRFVAQRIIPPGDHRILVAAPGQDKRIVEVERDINIPANDWFYVGLADFTIGKRFASGAIAAAKPGEYEGVYTRGRLAFYLKGKIKGEYLLTAAADTGDKPLGSLFRNLDEKDAKSILRRLDPDDYYLVYGDDSTIIEDAPTQGRFYVRLDKGDSHVMWGNYKTRVSGTTFLASGRALYGAKAHYKSPETTSFGERKTDVMVYAAQPGTLPQREVFRGTGGSAYFLKHQDITTGSETITAEVRDPVTGAVTERRVLIEGTDYDIDYLQGVLILRRSLPSIAGSSDPVRSTAVAGNEIYLVVQYEYTPASGDVSGYSVGGRAEQWINDRIRVAVTGMSEKTGRADQQALAADIRLRYSDRTYVEGELAGARGPGFGSAFSNDGGITNVTATANGLRGKTALAWRLRAQADLAEVTGGRLKGDASAYIEERQAGFQTLSENVSVDQRIWGAAARVEASSKLSIGARYDDYSDRDGKAKRNGQVNAAYRLDEHWKVSAGLDYTMLDTPNSTRRGYNGERLDAGVRAEYHFDEDRMAYAFGQGTLHQRGDIRRNDRVGAGVEYRMSDKLTLGAEVSYGTSGWGGLANIGYDPTPDDHYYIGYKLDPDRAWSDTGTLLRGADMGTIVAGAKRRLSDELSVFTESDLDLFGKKRTLGQTYGVNYQPAKSWTLTAGFEAGRIFDDSASGTTFGSDFDRKAVSASVAYANEERGLNARIRGEYRRERSADATRDMDTWLGGVAVAWKPDEDWRMQASADLLFSRSPGNSFRDGEYAEASIGAAYRPVDHDRFNMLLKYTFLYDLPGAAQVNANGDKNGPAQRSHIFSVDGNYDVNRWLTVGAKYGMRYGEQRNRTATIWSPSTAHLGILRADFHVIRKWDLLAEARVLHLAESDSTKFGFLAAAYRHFGDNMKIGIGYNFGHFSDDLRDLTYDDQGIFLNAIGKF
ncbi:MAG: TonB-dependent receptor [Notoacmeibacter sp.]|nr:TonB-dependent receptor [Notoacmeibacter sp.]MCC0033339.1 TonB-dependent receptor [Brucellaceae bacterium]